MKEAGKVEGKHCELLRRAYLGLGCASKSSLVKAVGYIEYLNLVDVRCN